MKIIEIVVYALLILQAIAIITYNVYEIIKAHQFFKKLEKQHEELLKSLEKGE